MKKMGLFFIWLILLNFVFSGVLPTTASAQFLDGVESITVSAPVAETKDVKICYGQVSRRTKCNYEQPGLSNMTVPFWGQITYTWRIVPNAESRASFEVINFDKKCRLHLKDETFMRHTRILGNGNVLSWDISQASLGDGSQCFSNDDAMAIRTVITLTVESNDGLQELVTVTLTNMAKPEPSSNSYQMQKVIVHTLNKN